jgi:predicted nucleic acid-binding protein
MNGNKLFLDTNILLYLLRGDDTLVEVLDKKQICISFITELELLSFPGLNKKDLKVVKDLLNECVIIDINAEIHPTKMSKPPINRTINFSTSIITIFLHNIAPARNDRR